MKYSLLLVGIFFLISCKAQIDKEQLKIIEDISLGKPVKEAIKLNRDIFTTETHTVNFKDIQGGQTRGFYTNTFNFSNYRANNNHLGIVWPTVPNFNENLIGLTILLAHTESLNDRKISQELPKDFIDEVVRGYTSKYGQPNIEQSNFGNYYAFEGASIETWQLFPDDDKVTIYSWETKHYTVKLFFGLYSHRFIFSKSRGYIPIDESYKHPLTYSQNEIPCYAYPFIQYKLKDETIEALKLNDKKL